MQNLPLNMNPLLVGDIGNNSQVFDMQDYVMSDPAQGTSFFPYGYDVGVERPEKLKTPTGIDQAGMPTEPGSQGAIDALYSNSNPYFGGYPVMQLKAKGGSVDNNNVLKLINDTMHGD